MGLSALGWPTRRRWGPALTARPLAPATRDAAGPPLPHTGQTEIAGVAPAGPPFLCLPGDSVLSQTHPNCHLPLSRMTTLSLGTPCAPPAKGSCRNTQRSTPGTQRAAPRMHDQTARHADPHFHSSPDRALWPSTHTSRSRLRPRRDPSTAVLCQRSRRLASLKSTFGSLPRFQLWRLW